MTAIPASSALKKQTDAAVNKFYEHFILCLPQEKRKRQTVL